MVALVIIYNHKFEKNIDWLEAIYSDKFSNIFHIMPFYQGKKSNVIPVYDHSFYFQGYVAQAYQQIKDKDEFEHFIFIADDMILHPNLNENTYKNELNLDSSSSFITYINSIATQGDYGYPMFFLHQASYFKLPKMKSGLEILNELPSYEEALSIFREKGFSDPYFRAEHIYSLPKRAEYKKGPIGTYWYLKRKKEVLKILNEKKIKPAYPLVCSYSDFFVIPQINIEKFAHYCGIFAACRLFVDYAIPTAMLLSCDTIRTTTDTTKRGIVMTGDGGDDNPLYDNQVEFEEKYQLSLNKLLDNFPDDAIFVHPIKLSKWKK